MYARVAQFEGIDPSAIDAQVAEIERQMATTAAEGLPEDAPPELEILMETIVRFVQLVDRETGTAIAIAFCDTEDTARRAHEALDAMSPGEGEGRRTSAGIFEVALDRSF